MNNQVNKIPVAAVFLGPPASGKGTAASYLDKKFDIKPVSPGNIFKNLRNQNTELSNLIIETTKDGGLCPDWLTNQVVFEEATNLINKGAKSISLDGYPRTLEQLDFLLEKFEIKFFIFSNPDLETLKISAEERRNCFHCKKVFSIKRANLICTEDVENCAIKSNLHWEKRWDDDLDVFNKRILTYNAETFPVIEKLCNFDNFIKINLLDENSSKIIFQLYCF
jgi:adenylate kinase